MKKILIICLLVFGLFLGGSHSEAIAGKVLLKNSPTSTEVKGDGYFNCDVYNELGSTIPPFYRPAHFASLYAFFKRPNAFIVTPAGVSGKPVITSKAYISRSPTPAQTRGIPPGGYPGEVVLFSDMQPANTIARGVTFNSAFIGFATGKEEILGVRVSIFHPDDGLLHIVKLLGGPTPFKPETVCSVYTPNPA